MDKMEIQVKFKCKPNVLEIYSYIMYYSFSGTAGAVRIGISILFLAIAWYTAGEVETILTLLLVLVGLLNPAVTPVCLYLRAVKMEKTETEIQYEIDEEKVLVCQNGVRRKLPFAVFPQIVWGKRCLLLYVDGSHALLIPRRQMNGAEDKLLEILRHLPNSGQVKIKDRKRG
jgi:hypothetical protein